MSNLAHLYQHKRRFEQAEKLAVRVLDVARRVYGEDNRTTLHYMHNLATLYSAQEKFPQAEQLLVQSVSVSRRVLEEGHPQTLLCLMNLIRLYVREGQCAQHEPFFRETMEGCRRVLGDEHPATLLVMEILALLYLEQRENSRAEPLIDKVLAVMPRIRWDAEPNADEQTKSDVLATMNNFELAHLPAPGMTPPGPSPSTRWCWRSVGDAWGRPTSMLMVAKNLAHLYWCNLKLNRAISLLEDVLKATRDRSGPDHPDTLTVMQSLAISYRDTGRLVGAIELLEQARAAALKRPDLPPGEIASISAALAQTCQKAGQLEKAETLCREALETLRRQPRGGNFTHRRPPGGSRLDPGGAKAGGRGRTAVPRVSEVP